MKKEFLKERLKEIREYLLNRRFNYINEPSSNLVVDVEFEDIKIEHSNLYGYFYNAPYHFIENGTRDGGNYPNAYLHLEDNKFYLFTSIDEYETFGFENVIISGIMH